MAVSICAAAALIDEPQRSLYRSSDARYDRAFDGAMRGTLVCRQRLEAERAEAPSLLARLQGQPLRRQLLLIRNSRRFHTRTCCEALLASSWRSRFGQPRICADHALLALEVSRLLPATSYGVGSIADLQARCWSELANARRILADYQGADEGFRQAADLLERGSGGPWERARFLDLRASLLSARNDYAGAEALLIRALGLYRDLGELGSVATALIKRGMIAWNAGHPERQIVFVRQGLELAPAQLEWQVMIGGWQSVILGLHEAGRDRDALAALAQARPYYLELADRTTLLRFQWLEGMVARSLGRCDQAEGCLAEARDGYLHLGMAHDAALVSFELAALLADQGRQAEVLSLVSEMIPIFESREARDDTLVALVLLRRAAEQGHVSRALVESLLASARGSRSRA